MVQKYIIDKTDLPKLIQGEELALTQGSKYRAFCIEINEKLTNGDVIKALFPDSELHKESDYAYLTISKGVYLEDRDGSWWNAPYKEIENDR